MNRSSVFILTFGIVCLQAFSQDVNSRAEKIQRLLSEAQSELDSLRQETASSSDHPMVSSETEKPAAEDLLTDRQKRLVRASRTPYRNSAAGYFFNPGFEGMDFIQWFGDWGAKLDASANVHTYTRTAEVNFSALRSLNRFSFLDGSLETHLYAFTGLGFAWEKIQKVEYLNNGGIVNVNTGWYSSPDLITRCQLGAGTEISLGFLGGIKFAPEVGLQASQYLKRYQDSPEWSQNNDPEFLPKSKFSLDAFYAFHLNFYFR